MGTPSPGLEVSRPGLKLDQGNLCVKSPEIAPTLEMVSLPGILQVAGFGVSQNTKSVSSSAKETDMRGRSQGQKEEQDVFMGSSLGFLSFQFMTLFVPSLLGLGGVHQLNISLDHCKSICGPDFLFLKSTTDPPTIQYLPLICLFVCF